MYIYIYIYIYKYIYIYTHPYVKHVVKPWREGGRERERESELFQIWRQPLVLYSVRFCGDAAEWDLLAGLISRALTLESVLEGCGPCSDLLYNGSVASLVLHMSFEKV